jgi:hypothetical protein
VGPVGPTKSAWLVVGRLLRAVGPACQPGGLTASARGAVRFASGIRLGQLLLTRRVHMSDSN